MANGKTIPGDLFLYIDISNPKSIDHFLEIKKLKPTHILFYGNKPKNGITRGKSYKTFTKLKKCLGPLLFYKSEAGKYTTRNPLIKSPSTYPGFIYKFE